MSPAPLVAGSELSGRPVVAIDCGDDIAEVKDVVFDPATHDLVGFSLNKRGWFRGSLKQRLPRSAIQAIGPVAVMVASADDLVDRSQAPRQLEANGEALSVIGTRVLSADGEALGEIEDIIFETGPSPRAAGYQVDTDDGPLFVPITAQLALSQDNVILPAEATPFMRNDLAGFGAAVNDYRATLGGTR